MKPDLGTITINCFFNALKTLVFLKFHLKTLFTSSFLTAVPVAVSRAVVGLSSSSSSSSSDSGTVQDATFSTTENEHLEGLQAQFKLITLQ